MGSLWKFKIAVGLLAVGLAIVGMGVTRSHADQCGSDHSSGLMAPQLGL